MNALHRKVAAGAFGGLATATAIGGIAFACSAVPSVQVTSPGTTNSVPTVRPGEVVDVRVGTLVDGVPVILTWDTPETATAPHSVAPIPSAAPLVGPSFVVTIAIPDTAQPTVGNNPSYIIATQRDPQGEILSNPAVKVYVAGGVNVPNTPVPNAPVPNAPVPNTPVPNTPVPNTPGVAPAPETSTVTPTPAGTSAPTAPRAGSTAAAPSVTPQNGTAPAASPAAVTATPAATPAGTPASPLTIGAPVAQPLAPTSDLWSGLNAGSTPSLLDVAPVERSNGNLPVGGILLGSGLLALAGVALVAGRRTLAVSRIVRR